jgi:hypothetical protein
MPKRSRYDELHDRYNTILTTKGGTRYEIVAAFVFKALEEQDTVIHDLSLVGESDVAHQIDVLVERNGVKHRVLIECKDFDISGEKIGLDIIRNFRSVLEDTGKGCSLRRYCSASHANPSLGFKKTHRGVTSQLLGSSSSLHFPGGLFNESCHSSRLRDVDGVAALDLNDRGARPLGHGTLGVRCDHPVIGGDQVPARLGPPRRFANCGSRGVHTDLILLALSRCCRSLPIFA